MQRKLLLAILIFGLLLVGLTACAKKTPTPTPTPIPSPTPEPTPTPEAAATSAEETPQHELTQLEQYYRALEALPAYSATLVMVYEPAPGTDVEPFRVEFEELRAQGEPERQWVHIHGLSSVDPNMKRNDAVYTFIGNKTWFHAGDERFYTTKSTRQRRVFLSPEDFIPPTTELKDMGPYPEPINGQKVHYYQIADGSQLFGNGPDQPVNPELLQGDVWVSEEGGYIVRYIIKIKADDLKLRPTPTPGTLTVEYNVTPLRPEDVDIQPPEDALTVEQVRLPGFKEGGFPLPEDADIISLVQADNEQLIYYAVVGVTPKEAYEDLKQKLEALGWQEIADDHQETEQFISTSWTKGDAVIMILFKSMVPHGGTEVMVRNGPPTSGAGGE